MEGPFPLVVGQFTPVQRFPSPESIIKVCQVISSTPRDFKHVLSTFPSSIPAPSPSIYSSRPSLASPISPSPIPLRIPSPVPTSQQLQHVASTIRRREDWSPFPSPASQVFQRREVWHIRVAREDANVVNEVQDAVVRILRRFDRNSREVIMYANDRIISGTASEEMAAKFYCYSGELIIDLKITSDDFGIDN
ncbi:hypothetical protein O181_092861 [Austropuccinia psidii MF-1]|uniref:Uncharacterized protein n=1 Tax=Austropuccinia psidii MF-1 TaxID=1389203 RepID=A0A9Q3PB16_9BASI|nr:hypothetical protein [Austropuccinia psidii MF-1]